MCKRSALHGVFGAALFLAALGTLPAAAQQNAQDWQDTPFQYDVVDQDVRQLFREYGRQLGILVQLSDNVRGRARNLHVDGTALDFLERLVSDHDLVWYYDGSILHVATTAEVARQALPIGSVPYDRLVTAVNQHSSTDPRLGIRPGADPDLVYVTGPASYYTFVQETASSLVEARPVGVRIWRAGKFEEVL